MSIKMDVHSIGNAGGGGAELRYVRLLPDAVRSRDRLKEDVCHSCSLTGGDVEAVLSALYDAALHDLSQGGRFYLPGIGYFTVRASVRLPRNVPVEKVRGNYGGSGLNPKEACLLPCAAKPVLYGSKVQLCRAGTPLKR